MENYYADLVEQATNFLADYNLFPITPNTSFFGHVLSNDLQWSAGLV